jgi:hypothetical protein
LSNLLDFVRKDSQFINHVVDVGQTERLSRYREADYLLSE